MRRTLFTLVLALSMLLNTAWAADFSRLVILHSNDTHGYDQRADGINGMATIAALKKDLQAKGYDVLLFDAGDATQDNNLVNFSQGKSAIAFMNAAGYDAMTLGNHEFDYGQDVTLKRVKEAKFPVLSANIIVEATGKPFLKKTDTIIKKGALKIGVFGLTTPETKVTTNPKNIYGLNFLGKDQIFTTAQNEVNKLKAAGCDLIVCLGHLGSEDANMGHRSDDVLQNVKGIDIFIDGHDHNKKNLRIGNTLLVETGSYTKNIGFIKHDGQNWKEELMPYGQFKQEDPQVKQLIDQAAAEVTKHMSLKVGTTDILLNGNRNPGIRTMETNLGDLCADAFLWQARMANVLSKGTVDGAILNGGGIRNSINPGAITIGSISSILPYNNQVYIMNINGATLLEILEAATSSIPEAIGAFPQVAGIKYVINTAIPYTNGKQYPHSTYFAPAKPGSRVEILEVNGKPFELSGQYTIASYEFLCRGGDAYGALLTPGAAHIHSIGYIDTAALINYIKEELHGVVGPAYAQPQGRVVIK